MEGYGIYWFLIERLADAGGKLPIELIPVLAMQMQTTDVKVKGVIVNFDLFKIQSGEFWSERLQDHLNIRQKLSESGKSGALNRWKNKDENGVAIRGANREAIGEGNAKERKGKERKVNKKVVVDTATATTEVLNLDTQLPEPNRAVLAGQMTLEECANKAYKETGLQLCEELRLTAQNSPDYDKLRVSIQKFVSHLKSEFKSHYEPREFNRHFKAWYRKRPNDDFNPPKQQKTKEDYERESQEFLKNLK